MQPEWFRSQSLPDRETLDRMTQRSEPEDDVRHGEPPAGPSRAGVVTRIQVRTGGFVARHPALLKTMQWLGWNNPGGSMNP